MKKFMKSGLSKEKAANFFDREGFYIVLFICVCIVAVTAVWVSRTGIKNDKDPNLADVKDNKTTINTPAAPVEEPPAKESQANTPATEETADEEAKAPAAENKAASSTNEAPVAAAPKVTAAASVFNIDSPVKTALSENIIMRDYSPDELVCFQYLNEWKTHAGLDLETYEGMEVLAVGDGKVIDVRNDNDYTGGLGWTVVVDHNNGYRSVYSNLAETLSVEKNQTVKKGQKLGTVGKTSAFEKDIADDISIEDKDMTHLHFELLKKTADNSYENVDPKKYFITDDD